MTIAQRDPAADRARPKDTGEVAGILARAFQDDPVVSWVVPDADRRRMILPDIFGLLTEMFLTHGETYLLDDRSGAALWTPPGATPVDEDQEQSFGERLEGIAGSDAPRAFEVLELMAQHHPEDPSFYLGFVGVIPERQGRGLGGRLLSAVLPRCDEGGVPAYLEATSMDNRRLYERNGFETIGEIRLPDGPALWPMWRDAVVG